MSADRPVKFGKYLLVEKLATGGMAQVFKAKIMGAEGFEKMVAIKQILPHLTVEKELVTSFIDEAKLAASLHHQNIVQIYDFGNMEGTYYIAMEYLLGKDLRMIANRARDRNTQFSLEHSLYIMSRVCAGLDYAHKLKDLQGRPLNIIHRDISPQNVIVTYEGEVKIVDFGIAKAATQSSMTQVGMIKGKVAYMSPEQASGKHIDHRSDIFATGILLYELVTGNRMFQGDTLHILAKVRDAEFEPAENIVSGLPQMLYKILKRALAKEPEDRYQSCGEMLDDIEACIFGPEKLEYNTKICEGNPDLKGCMIDLSLKPTVSGLAHYMKELFAEDMSSELQAFRDTGEIHIGEEPAREAGAGHTVMAEVKPQAQPQVGPAAKPEEKIIAQPKKEAAQREKKKLPVAYIAIAAVIAIGLLFVLLPKGKDVQTPEKAVTEKAAQPPVSQQAETRVPEKSVAPEQVKKQEPAEDPQAKARALQEQAAGLMETQPQKAMPLLLEAVKADPKSVQAHFHLGMVHMKLKDNAKAIDSFNKAAQLDPKFSDAYFNLGYIYAINKNYPKAEEMYAKVVILSPSYLDEALFNLGIMQEKQGKRQQCIESIERAVKVNPGNQLAVEYLQKLKRKS